MNFYRFIKEGRPSCKIQVTNIENMDFILPISNVFWISFIIGFKFFMDF